MDAGFISVVMMCISTCFVVTHRSNIHLIKNEQNWTEARHICRTMYRGHLAKLDVTKESDISLLRSCMPTGTRAWFGNYSIASPFIAIIGCYNENFLKSNLSSARTLLYSSASVCERECKTEYFAVQGQLCWCLETFYKSLFLNERRPASMCNITCGLTVCGGIGVINTYRSLRVTGLNRTAANLLCFSHNCIADETLSTRPLTANCSEMLPFSCGDGYNVTQGKTWRTAFTDCISRRNSYLENDFACPSRNKSYWNGYFQEDEFVFDSDSVPGLPRVAIAILNQNGVFSLASPSRITDNLRFDFLCEFDVDQTKTPLQSGEVCNSVSDPIVSDKTDSSTIRMPSENASTDTNLVIVDLESQRESIELTLVIGVTCGGGALLILTVVVGTVIYRSNRNSAARNTKTSDSDPAEGAAIQDIVPMERVDGQNDNTVYYSTVKSDNDDGDQNKGIVQTNVFVHSGDDTYDHLHAKDENNGEPEGRYGHVGLRHENNELYDVTSGRDDTCANIDVDDNYSKFTKPDGIYDK